MDPAGPLGLAARKLIMRGARATGLMAVSMRAALGALSHTAAAIALTQVQGSRPARAHTSPAPESLTINPVTPNAIGSAPSASS
jgi:hypothetical protein